MLNLRLISLSLLVAVLTVSPQGLCQQVSDFQPCQLAFTVKKVESVEGIRGFLHELSAKEGYQVVLVTIGTSVQKPCRLSFSIDSFAAVYEQKPGDAESPMTVPYIESKGSSAVKIGEDEWAMLKPIVSAYTINDIRTGPLEMKVAFTLPAYVKRFYFAYPSLTKEPLNVATK